MTMKENADYTLNLNIWPRQPYN